MRSAEVSSGEEVLPLCQVVSSEFLLSFCSVMNLGPCWEADEHGLSLEEPEHKGLIEMRPMWWEASERLPMTPKS